MITKKIDFAVVFSVKNANPNGDPANGNMPRQLPDGTGIMQDVAIKRKIRNRMRGFGKDILIHPAGDSYDGATSVSDRLEKNGLDFNSPEFIRDVCSKFYDVRAFGAVLALKSKVRGEKGVSIGIRGAVSIQSAYSVAPITVDSASITKSVNMSSEDESLVYSTAGKSSIVSGKKESSTMGGEKFTVSGNHYYVFFGAINGQASELTGFSDQDAIELQNALVSLFEGDASAARPEGSMEVVEVIWWEHSCPLGDASSAKVHRSLSVSPDGKIEISEFENEQGKKIIPKRLKGF